MSARVRNGLFTAIVVLTIFIAGWLVGRENGRQVTYDNVMRVMEHISGGTKIGQVVSLIENSYVDSISADSLAELAIPAILEKLDPHSVYIPARDLEQTEEPLQGEFDGIGVVFNMATDTVIVLNVIPSGPSQKAGIQSGDRIVSVNDTLIAGVKMAQSEVMKRLRGPRGTQVKLLLERIGISEPVEVVVTRDAIPLHSVEAAVMLTDRVGFIKLSQFSRTSHREVVEAIEKLKGEGMSRLVFDLRGNSGGFLDQAILISNEFLPKGAMIVYTEDREHRRKQQFSDGRGRAQNIPMVVLIDEYSASSSEILAGALQDNDRATIVGRRSFGKGLVQQQIAFTDGSALRLTVARYFTPTGRSIQKPYSQGTEDYETELLRRFNNNEFFSADSIHFNDSLRFTTPKGKVVYGGGGIMPDTFIPLDTTRLTKYFVEVSGRNILYRYTIEYSDRHRAALDSVKTFNDIKALFAADLSLLNDFVKYASRQGVKPVWSEIESSRELIMAQLKAYISRNTPLDNNAFYYFIWPIDHTLSCALDECKDI